jgi:hypothetical protein
MSIYLLDKFFEASTALPYDDAAVAKAKKQLYLAERLSLLMHELGHGGKLNYLTDRPAPKDPFDSEDGEVRVRADMGTGDKDCYLAQYYLMRILMDQALADYKAAVGTEFSSAVFSAVLSQLRDLNVIQFDGDTKDDAVRLEAMKKADMALALKYGISVPKTLGRKVAEPPSSAVAAGSPSPKPSGGTGSAGGGKAMTDAEYGAAVAAAWSEVVARDIAEKNTKSPDGTRYRLQWVSPFAYRRERDKDYLVGAYCMWQKNPGADQKEFVAFEFGGNKAGDVGYLLVSQAAAGVQQYNQKHPEQKIKLPEK